MSSRRGETPPESQRGAQSDETSAPAGAVRRRSRSPMHLPLREGARPTASPSSDPLPTRPTPARWLPYRGGK